MSLLCRISAFACGGDKNAQSGTDIAVNTGKVGFR